MKNKRENKIINYYDQKKISLEIECKKKQHDGNFKKDTDRLFIEMSNIGVAFKFNFNDSYDYSFKEKIKICSNALNENAKRIEDEYIKFKKLIN